MIALGDVQTIQDVMAKWGITPGQVTQNLVTNSQAANDYAGIGHPAQCETIATVTPGANYTQNVCTVQGSQNLHDANLTLLMTPAQLQADLAFEQSERARLNALTQGATTRDWGTGYSALNKSAMPVNPLSVLFNPASSEAVPNTVATSSVANTQANQATSVVPTNSGVVQGTTSITDAVKQALNNLVSGAQNLVPSNIYSDISGQDYTTSAPYVNKTFSALEQTVPIGNWDIPIWALGLVGIGGLLVVSKMMGSQTGYKRR